MEQSSQAPIESHTNRLALVSLALGVLGFLVVPFVGSLDFGIDALRSAF